MSRIKVTRRTLALVGIALGLASLWLIHSILAIKPIQPFGLATMTNDPAGPKAIFEQPRRRPSRLLPLASIGSNTRIWVFRRGQWAELTQTEASQRTNFDLLVVGRSGGKKTARWGYTLTVDVPVCEKWKVQLDIAEGRRVGPKALGLNFTMTNSWESAELPGWSNIRNSFNALSNPTVESGQPFLR